ncbi:unnamed protein product [Prunus armeniaca]|uniref:Uncharacterized protein n=1 Tax=Prunus armeniaca TaxID=36596 RepID=A0A6J5U2S5_PRUAR|nr:unnamed protein product [Prunus armeniaca]CAB4300886.1 unnamed protein product [Prunus armeniaca]
MQVEVTDQCIVKSNDYNNIPFKWQILGQGEMMAEYVEYCVHISVENLSSLLEISDAHLL